MASTVDPWWDFQTVHNMIRSNTVDRLKQIINGINDECLTNLAKSGKKQELIDRITYQLDSWKNASQSDKWQRAKAVIYQVRTSGTYTPQVKPNGGTYHTSTSHGTSAYSLATPNKLNGHASTSSSVAPRYDPYAPAPSRTPQVTTAKPSLRFKPSPFFRIEQAVSPIQECPESGSATDRRTAAVTFTLAHDHMAKLNSTTAKYQLRLYCTSSTYYSPSQYRASQELCLMEFPPTCEIRVNNVALNANVKGLKKKPGTAPPADLGTAVKYPGPNRIDMVYVNSQQNAVPKKYYLAVMLVEVTSVDQLVERLKKGKYRGRDTIVQSMKARASEDDDDIVSGPIKMSLRDSLTFLRVAVPCRSEKCVHPQCFDAATWYSMMEQTTTWLCPVCDKVLDTDDLIVDGYFEGILEETNDDIEDVMVEADGEWHTSDDKFASVGWRATHPVAPVPAKARSPTPVKATAGPISSAAEIVVLDSDEEDEGRVKRELSPRYGTGSFSTQSSYGTLPPSSQLNEPVGGVIDLTVDDSDEGQSPTPPRRTSAPLVPLYIPSRSEKRKTAEELSPSEAVWKKSRAGTGHTNGDTSSTSGTASPHGPSSSASSAYPTSYASSYAARRSPPADDRYAHDRYSRYRSPPRSGPGYYSGSSRSRTPSAGYHRGYGYPPSGTDTSRWT